MVKPPEMVSRLDLVVLELVAARTIFCRCSRGFLDFWEFIELRGGGTEAGVGQQPPGHAWPLWRSLVGVPHLGLRLRYFFLSTVVFWPKKKSTKSFAAFGLRLIWIFCKSKTGQKTTTSTWHYVNRLVPKNDIKLIGNHSKTSKIDHISAWNNQKL